MPIQAPRETDVNPGLYDEAMSAIQKRAAD